MDDLGYLGKFWVAYISANNRVIDTKPSAYDPWGLPTTSRIIWMTLSTWVGGHDHYRSIFFVYPISQPILEILTRNFQHIVFGVYSTDIECHA